MAKVNASVFQCPAKVIRNQFQVAAAVVILVVSAFSLWHWAATTTHLPSFPQP